MALQHNYHPQAQKLILFGDPNQIHGHSCPVQCSLFPLWNIMLWRLLQVYLTHVTIKHDCHTKRILTKREQKCIGSVLLKCTSRKPHVYSSDKVQNGQVKIQRVLTRRASRSRARQCSGGFIWVLVQTNNSIDLMQQI